MSKMIELFWNDRAGVGDIRISKKFENGEWVMKADALTDWIWALQQEYNHLLDKGPRDDE